MSVSAKKLRANRLNAKKSRGATTPAGRAASSQNAVKHGLCSSVFRVQPTEQQWQFDELYRQFVEAEKPLDSVEFSLVRKMTEATWQSARAVRLQEGCITATQSPEQKANNIQELSMPPQFERFLRYQAAYDRAYARAAKELREKRKERQLAERGVVSQKRQEAAEARKEAAENRQKELHPHRVAAAKARSEREQTNTTLAAIKLGDKIASSLSPEDAKAFTEIAENRCQSAVSERL
jgi:hypothetical protein